MKVRVVSSVQKHVVVLGYEVPSVARSNRCS